jgi:hypothetical protein
MLEFNLDELRKRGYDEETFSDEDLFGAGETICEIISLFTNRDFGLKTVTLKLDGDGTNELILPIPIVSITSVTDDSGLVASTDYVSEYRDTGYIWLGRRRFETKTITSGCISAFIFDV